MRATLSDLQLSKRKGKRGTYDRDADLAEMVGAGLGYCFGHEGEVTDCAGVGGGGRSCGCGGHFDGWSGDGS